MSRNEILLLLTDRWCDWETGYATASLNSFFDYSVKTVALDKIPKISMGGIKAEIDYCTGEYNNFDRLSMVIIPGGLSWEKNDYDEIAKFVQILVEHKIPVAAICGATYFLCKHGFLDNIKHTGDSLALFQTAQGYKGEKHYIPAQVVTDGGFITANETAAVEFAYEIFKILNIDSDESLRKWLDTFQNGAIQ